MESSFFQRNRQALLATLPDDALIVMTAYAQMQWGADMAVPFRQEANFFWVSGIRQPQWTIAFSTSESVLIAPDIDPTRTIFEGGLTHDEALSMSGVNRVINQQEAEAYFKTQAEHRSKVYALGELPHKKYYDFVLNPASDELYATLETDFSQVLDIRANLLKLRAIKSTEEIAAIRRAVDVTIDVFEQAKREISSSTFEYEIEATINGGFRRTGADGYAYESIVAGGKNACTLHYVANQASLTQGTGLLIDAGAQWQGYAADVTRTYAIGEPSQRLRDIHRAVEKAHHQIIDLIKPGVAVKDYIERVDVIMKQALKSVDLLNSEDDYHRYFPHAISHGFGLDVHESLGGYETFQPGMVLTVEPGIYVPEEKIGVRIEDDILVTEQGNENLSGRLSMGL